MEGQGGQLPPPQKKKKKKHKNTSSVSRVLSVDSLNFTVVSLAWQRSTADSLVLMKQQTNGKWFKDN